MGLDITIRSPIDYLPNIFIAYRTDLSEGSEVFHNNIRERFDNGDPAVLAAMTGFANLTTHAKICLENGDFDRLSELMNANFDLRASLYQISFKNRQMVNLARSVGASAKFTGSGGAIIGIYKDETMLNQLNRKLRAYNIQVIKPKIVCQEYAPIRKAIIPAAGFGTRMLPATKAMPKEMIPIVDKPVIQYVVEEAVAAGITDILMVVGSGKRAVEEHFSPNVALENRLADKGKFQILNQLRAISNLANIHFIWQRELNGLGDAVKYGRFHIGNEPFVVLLGDTIMASNNQVSVTKQLIEAYESCGHSIIGLEEVPQHKVSRYGVMGGTPENKEGLYRVSEWVEKPRPEDAPSNLVIASRYLFTPAIFELLEHLPPGLNNEIQLTDAMHLLLKKEPMFGLKIQGNRFDVGNKLDYIKTNLLFGLQHPEFKHDLWHWLNQLKLIQQTQQ